MKSLLFTEAGIIGMLFFSGTLLYKDVCLLVSWYSTVGNLIWDILKEVRVSFLYYVC